jgi:hypothetical protein
MTDTSVAAPVRNEKASKKSKPWDPIDAEIVARNMAKPSSKPQKPQHTGRNNRGQTKPGMRRH